MRYEEAGINFKAVAAGLAAFTVPYLAIALLGDSYKMGQPTGSLFIYQLVLLVLGGYVAGRLAETNAVVNGVLAGIFAPLAIGAGYVANMLQPSLAPEMLMSNLPLWLLQSVAGSGVGAFFSTFGAEKD